MQSQFSEESSASILKNEDGSSDDSDGLEEKLSDALELASSKTAKDRTKAMDGIRKAFSKKYIPWYVEDRQLTITDTVERCLKRGKFEEQIAAAKLTGVFCAQIGCEAEDDEAYNNLKAILTPLVLDPTVDPRARGAMAHALSMTCFLLGDVAEYESTLETLEKVFAGSYKGGNKLTPDTLSMHTAALSSWTLLMSMMSPIKCYNVLER